MYIFLFQDWQPVRIWTFQTPLQTFAGFIRYRQRCCSPNDFWLKPVPGLQAPDEPCITQMGSNCSLKLMVHSPRNGSKNYANFDVLEGVISRYIYQKAHRCKIPGRSWEARCIFFVFWRDRFFSAGGTISRTVLFLR